MTEKEAGIGDKRGEHDTFVYFVNTGVPEFITPDNFPNLSPDTLLLGRVFAYDNLIDRVRSAIAITQDTESRRKLGILATNLIKERDMDLGDGLSTVEGEADESLVIGQGMFRQPGEANGALDIAIRLGLVGQINERNFQALRALPQPEIAYLRMMATRNRLQVLRDNLDFLQKMQQSLGFNPGAENHGNLRNILQREIETEQLRFARLIAEI